MPPMIVLTFSLALVATDPIIVPTERPDAPTHEGTTTTSSTASTPSTATNPSTSSTPSAKKTPSLPGEPKKETSAERRKFHRHTLVFERLTKDCTPLVVAFDGADAHVAWSAASPTPFEFEPGTPAVSKWPSAKTPWLVRDLDRDGGVRSGRALFGSFTLVGDPGREHHARDGFEALGALDDNGDGVVDARDAAFRELALWRDTNGNRVVDDGELEPLAHAGIAALPTAADVDAAACGDGYCERERAVIRYRDQSGALHAGALIDVHLRVTPLNVPAL